MSIVINLRQAPDALKRSCVRIDRTGPWGNPFVVGKHGTREAVIEQHRKWLWNRLQHAPDRGRLLVALAELDGRVLGCWCEPLPCHGHTLARAAMWAKEQLLNKLLPPA